VSIQHTPTTSYEPQFTSKIEGTKEGRKEGGTYLVLDIVLDGVLQEVLELEEDLR
jgi:hypothetical protein